MAEEGKTSIPEFDFDLEVVPTDIVEDTTPPAAGDETPLQDPPAEPQPPAASEETPPATPPAETPPNDDTPPEIPEGADPTAFGIYQTLVSKGYTAESEEFKGTFDELDEIFDTLPDKVFEGLMASMPPILRKAIEYGYQKGDSLTQEDLANFWNAYSAPTVEGEVDLETVEGQRDYLKKSLMKGGQDEETALDLLDLWEDKGTLAERAKVRKKSDDDAKEAAAAQAIEDAKAEKLNRKKAQQAFITNIKSNIDSTDWKPATRKLVLNEIFSGGLNEKTKIISKHPKALVQLANYLRHFDVEKGEIDESSFKAQAFSGSAKEVKNTIEKHFSGIQKAKAQQMPNTSGDKSKSHEFEFAD